MLNTPPINLENQEVWLSLIQSNLIGIIHYDAARAKWIYGSNIMMPKEKTLEYDSDLWSYFSMDLTESPELMRNLKREMNVHIQKRYRYPI